MAPFVSAKVVLMCLNILGPMVGVDQYHSDAEVLLVLMVSEFLRNKQQLLLTVKQFASLLAH